MNTSPRPLAASVSPSISTARRSASPAAHAAGALLLASSVACGGGGFGVGEDDAGETRASIVAESSSHDTKGSGDERSSASSRTGRTTAREASSSKRRTSSGEASSERATRADGGSPDAAATTTNASTSVVPDAGIDAGPACATKTASEGIGVFLVSSPVPAKGACGLIANPCTDLASAIAALSDTRRTIYVGPGTYTPVAPATDFPELPAGVSIVGGWNVTNSVAVGYTFTATCDANATFSSAGEAVFSVGSAGQPFEGTVELDTLAVVGTAVARPSQSAYGIRAVGTRTSSLVLRNVTVKAVAGGAGEPAPSAAAGAPGVTGNCPADGDGSPGAGGYAGGPTTFGPGGAAAGAEGQGGAPGSAGAAGAVGAPRCQLVTTGCTEIFNDGGFPGCGHTPLTNVCTPTPLPGCGGAGGSGGLGGLGGGSSIAVYAWGTSLTLDGAALTAGEAGAGGRGGSGGEGGAAGVGQDATTVTAPYMNARLEGCIPRDGEGCYPSGMSTFDALTSGGNGTLGGAGGQGGGGAGGDSYAYYLGGGASASVVGEVTFTPRIAGAGAPGGAPNGTAGFAGPTNTED